MLQHKVVSLLCLLYDHLRAALTQASMSDENLLRPVQVPLRVRHVDTRTHLRVCVGAWCICEYMVQQPIHAAARA